MTISTMSSLLSWMACERHWRLVRWGPCGICFSHTTQCSFSGHPPITGKVSNCHTSSKMHIVCRCVYHWIC